MNVREHRDFLRIWTGLIVSNLGDGIHRIAILWWARQSTGSDTVVVLVALATVLPLLVASPFAGVLVDRMPRRTLMALSDVTRLGTSAALAVLVAADALTTPALIALAATASVATAVFDPALLASVTVLVPEEARATANSMIGGAGAVAGIIGPALGGVLIGGFGTASALWIDAGTFAVSMVLVLLSRIPMVAADPADHGSGASGGMWAGWDLVRRDRSIRDLVLIGAGLNLCVAPVGVLVVGLAAGPLGLDGRGFGFLEAAVPAGLLIGLAVAPALARKASVGLPAAILTGLGLGAVGLVAWSPWAALMLLLGGVGAGVVNTVLPTRFQAAVEPAVQGRVFALVGAIAQVGRPIGLVLAAPLVAGVGVRAGLAVCGIALVITSLAGRRGLGDGPKSQGASGEPRRYTASSTSFGERHEDRHPPELQRRAGEVLMRQHVHDTLYAWR